METLLKRHRIRYNVTEKRQLERFAFNVPARVVVPGRGNAGEIHGRTRDLSAGGAFLFLGQSLAVGEIVELEIELNVNSARIDSSAPQETFMRGTGTVTRQETDGLAISFEGQLQFAS